jgi:hypothetical protein
MKQQFHMLSKVKYSYQCNRPWRPIELCDVEASIFSIPSTQMAVRLSALRASRVLPTELFSGTHFC